MAQQFSNYGSMSYDPEVEFSGQNREITALCDSITTNIYTINSATKKLEKALRSLGTAQDTHALRDDIHVLQLGTKEVIGSSTKDAATLAKLARTCKKQQQLLASKLTDHFQEAVGEFTKKQRAVVEALRKSLPRQQSVEEEQGYNEEDERQQLVLQQKLQTDVDLIVEREMHVRKIESEITDINAMMITLSTQVKQQAEAVDTIEANVESTRANVETGHSELASASRILSKMRKRNLVFFVILVLILATLIGILVWASR